MCPHIVSLRLVVEGETQRRREGVSSPPTEDIVGCLILSNA